jgi:hypothetical protein
VGLVKTYVGSEPEKRNLNISFQAKPLPCCQDAFGAGKAFSQKPKVRYFFNLSQRQPMQDTIHAY